VLIDTHAHLNDSAFDGDREEVIGRAAGAAVDVIDVGVNLATSEASAALSAQHTGIYAAAGVHPHEAYTLTASDIDALRRLCLLPKVVAVGETGLDWFRDLSPRPAQREAFAAHLALATEVDLPVIIHNREADADVLDILRQSPRRRGVMHAFSSGLEMARACLDAGLYLSFAGPLTYKSAEETRAAARFVPLDRLLIETDSPYLPPVPWRGQRNEPSYLFLIAQAMADTRGMDVAEVAAITQHNAQVLFRLPALVEDR
jgi:TatD DNase family protein